MLALLGSFKTKIKQVYRKVIIFLFLTNLEQIFDLLDGDRDNCISIEAINVEAVPRDVI